MVWMCKHRKIKKKRIKRERVRMSEQMELEGRG